MRVELAKSAGFCFGVKRAMDTVYRLADDESAQVYTLGPIIHNEQVVSDLEKRGVFVTDRVEEIENPEKSILVIRSHERAYPMRTLPVLLSKKYTKPFILTVKKATLLLLLAPLPIRKFRAFLAGQWGRGR